MKKPLKVLMTVALSLILAGVVMSLVVNTIHFFPYHGDEDDAPLGI